MSSKHVKGAELSIFLADDHLTMRTGLKTVIESKTDYSVAGEASDGLESVNLIKALKPDVAIVDINIPKTGGLLVLDEVKRMQTDTKVVLYGNRVSEAKYRRALVLNADAILLKECAWEETLNCIESVHKGQKFICSNIASYDNPEMVVGKEQLEDDYGNLSKLTKNETEILKLISEKRTTKEIADTLFKSRKTIENIRYNICKKLELFGHNSLMIFAIQNRSLLMKNYQQAS